MPASHHRESRAVVWARVWFAFVALVIIVSIGIQMALLFTGGADANSGESGVGVDVGVRLFRLFLYFTMDSNVVVMLVCLGLIADPLRTGFWWESLRLNAVLAITVTGVVYNTILAPGINLGGWAQATTVGLHVVSPLAFVGGWLVFGPRRRLPLATVPAAFVLPLLWIGFTFVHGGITGWYPYPFLDVTVLGFVPALVNSTVILTASAGLGLIYRIVGATRPGLLPQGSETATLPGRAAGP